MNVRFASLCGALALALVLGACSADRLDDNTADAGPDASLSTGTGSCTGGCGPNQVCDEARHVCVDGCQGFCAVGQLCVNQNGVFTCVTPQTSCDGTACGAGQSACVDGTCSCLSFREASRDTCADQGKVCHDPFNPVTNTGGTCENPRTFEYCLTNCSGPGCGVCSSGKVCDAALFGDFGVCVNRCTTADQCSPDATCYNGACYPKSLFQSQGTPYGCGLNRTGADGGAEWYPTNPGDKCLVVDSAGTAEATPTGTCTWAFLRTDTASFPLTYCRSPGPIPEYGACKTDPLPTTTANTCASGLECAPVGESGDGVCLRICNAISGASPTCATGESCVNIYRTDDGQSSVGVCMDNCSVFSTQPNYACGATGTVQTSCVATSAQGTRLVSGNGSGVCIPQRPNAGAEGAPCADNDPFQGATCQSGLLCTRASGAATATCVKPCDVECIPGDGGVPARCATEANATCGAGKTCTLANSSSATLGFCL